MFLMIAGFSFGFMIMKYGNNHKECNPCNQNMASNSNQDEDGTVFEAPWKNFVLTLAMSMGEFNSKVLYESFDSDTYSRSIAMMILVLLMMFGNIAMVNLFITVIMSDLEELKKRVSCQNIINMAQYAIIVEDVNPTCLLK